MTALEGGDILALTSAALRSLNGPETITNVPSPNGVTESHLMKGSKFTSGAGAEDVHRPTASSHEGSSLSPLTISARDIDGGSKDFTEYCDGGPSFSDVDGPSVASCHKATEKLGGGEVVTLMGRGKGDFATPPRGTSSPALPVRVRVSASKLRQIPSPLSTVNTSALSCISDNSSIQGQRDCSEVGRSKADEPMHPISSGSGSDATKAKAIPQVWTVKSLKQGVLLNKQDGKRTLNSSDDSVVMSGHPAQSNSAVKRSRSKLLQGSSEQRCASTGGTLPMSTLPRRVDLVKLSSPRDSLQSTKMVKQPGPGGAQEKRSGSKDCRQHHKPGPHSSDVVETAKLVATCTAAATAAILASRPDDTKPARNKASSSPLPHSAPEIQQMSSRRSQHGLPAGTVRAKQSVTIRDVDPRFKQEVDKYGCVDGRDAHSREGTMHTAGLSRKQRKQNMEKEEKKTKPIVEKNSSQEETTPLGTPGPDWCKPTQQLTCDCVDVKGKGGCLHHRNIQTTSDLARKRNCERDSCHTAPTLNSETVAATLISAKNDITSIRTRGGTNSLADTPTSGTHAQLVDVIDRVKKLEDLQHVRNMELQSKGSWHLSDPISSLSNGTRVEDGPACYTSYLPGRSQRDKVYRTRSWGRSPYDDEASVLHDKRDTRLPVGPALGGTLDLGDREEVDKAELGTLYKQASPSLADSHHTCVHSKASKTTKGVDSDEEKAHSVNPTEARQEFDLVVTNTKDTKCSSGSGTVVEDPLENEVINVLVNAQKVLFEVQSAKRSMEMQSDLDENERAFGDLVGALRDTFDDRCQEGIPWKVAEFLSSLPPSEGVEGSGGVEGKDRARDREVKQVDVTNNKPTRRNESNKRVKFDDRQLPSHHVPIPGPCCRCRNSIPNTTYNASKSFPSRFCPAHNSVSRRPLGYSSLPQNRPLPTANVYRHTREKDIITCTSQAPSSDATGHSRLQPPPRAESLPPTAVPLGAPCIMPSPFYDELDKRPDHSLLTAAAGSTQGYREMELEQEETSQHIAEESGGSSVSERSQSPCSLKPVESQTTKDSAKNRIGNGSVARTEVTSDNSYSSVQDQSTDTSTVVEMKEDMAVSIAGQRAPSPPPDPQQVYPLLSACGDSCGAAKESTNITSEELDKRLQDHLKCQATEWIGRELMARMLAGMECPIDPIPPHCHSDRSSFSGPEPGKGDSRPSSPISDSTMAEVVKDVVKESIVNLLREMADKQPPQEKLESEEDYSYTTPDSGSMTSSGETTPLLSTPQATPPQSPSPTQTPEIEELTLQADLATPTETPPLSLRVEVEESPVSTPQATEEDVSTATEFEQSHVCSKSLSSVDHPASEVSTPATTPVPDPISLESPQSSESSLPPVVMVDKSQQVTPVHHTPQPLSESITTSTSGSQADTSSTSGSTTFKDISEGEIVRRWRPSVPFALNTSISEGEALLSPGDARWHSVYAAKMSKAGLMGWKSTKSKRKLDPAVETFLDLKNSQDPSSTDSSQLSDDTQKVYSIGEVKKSKRRLQGDPFDKFLSRLNTMSPESSSTPMRHGGDEDSENTLSEMPSIHHDKMTARQSSKVHQKIRVIPYHRKHPLLKGGKSLAATAGVLMTGASSPGEVPRHIRSLNLVRGGQKEEAISLTHSAGEIVGRSKALRNAAKVLARTGPASPESNAQRDGIDVINISRHSVHSSSTDEQLDEVSSLASAATDDVIRVEPSSTQVIQVRSYEESEASRTETPVADQVSNKPSQSIINQVSSKPSQSLVNQVSNKPSQFLVKPVSSKPSQSLVSSKSLEPKVVVGVASKPLTVVIPTAEVDVNVSSGDSPGSVSENIEVSHTTSDFEFSSISIPGF